MTRRRRELRFFLPPTFRSSRGAGTLNGIRNGEKTGRYANELRYISFDFSCTGHPVPLHSFNVFATAICHGSCYNIMAETLTKFQLTPYNCRVLLNVTFQRFPWTKLSGKNEKIAVLSIKRKCKREETSVKIKSDRSSLPSPPPPSLKYFVTSLRICGNEIALRIAERTISSPSLFFAVNTSAVMPRL